MTPEGLLVFLRVTPNAGRDAIEGAEIRADASAVLRMRVSAVPDKGKANAAVIVLLAKALGVAKSTISLISGDTARQKTVLVAGDGPALAAKLSLIA